MTRAVVTQTSGAEKEEESTSSGLLGFSIIFDVQTTFAGKLP